MKIKLYRILKTVSFLVIFCILFSGVTYVLRHKGEAEIPLPFYEEEKDSLDVVFIGSSHSMCSVLPMELYEDKGIASYVFASSAQVTAQSFYQLQAALERQMPKLIVLDVSGVIYDTKIGSEEFTHVQIDNMEFSRVKYQAIFDLFEPADRLEYIFNIIRFHTRWKEVEKKDFLPITSYTKGAVISTVVKEQILKEPVPPEEKEALPEISEKYLRKSIELCQEQGIEVLLYNAPACDSVEFARQYNMVADIADEYGVQYINFMYLTDEIGIDPTTDFRDEAHCNVYGAQKVTKYLGDYLTERYDLPDRREDPAYTDWNIQYGAYRNAYTY